MTATVGTVLVVDDDPTIRAFLVDALRGEGYAVDAAADGAQAIQLLEQRRPPTVQLCLILLDMMMPRVDGCGILRYLADLGNYVPVVAMSASPQALSAATVAGAQAALAKPFDLDRLLTVCHPAQNKA
jgi:two-component system, OmpR family, response regulator MprA